MVALWAAIIAWLIVAALGSPWHALARCLVGIGIAALLINLGAVVLMILKRRAHYRAASRHLGVRLTWRNYPPLGDAAFDEWRQRHPPEPNAQ